MALEAVRGSTRETGLPSRSESLPFVYSQSPRYARGDAVELEAVQGPPVRERLRVGGEHEVVGIAVARLDVAADLDLDVRVRLQSAAQERDLAVERSPDVLVPAGPGSPRSEDQEPGSEQRGTREPGDAGTRSAALRKGAELLQRMVVESASLALKRPIPQPGELIQRNCTTIGIPVLPAGTATDALPTPPASEPAGNTKKGSDSASTKRVTPRIGKHVKLGDLGVTKSQSHRWQQVAAVDESVANPYAPDSTSNPYAPSGGTGIVLVPTARSTHIP